MKPGRPAPPRDFGRDRLRTRLSNHRKAAFALTIAACAVAIGTANALGTSQQQRPPDSAPLLAASPLPAPPGTTDRVSVGNDERQANGASGGVSAILAAANGDQAISADGRWVAFVSTATNLDPNQARSAGGVFLRDRLLGDTSALPWFGGALFPASISAAEPTISRDGSVVAFTAVVVPNPAVRAIALPTRDPYVLAWDRLTNLTEIVSLDANGGPVPGFQPSISADGFSVAYTQWFVDRTPPTPFSLTANPSHIGGCTGPQSSTISVTVTDPDDAVSSVTLFYSPSSGSTSKPMKAVGSNVWQADITRESDWFPGDIPYSVQASDSHGNTSALVVRDSSNTLTLDGCIL